MKLKRKNGGNFVQNGEPKIQFVLIGSGAYGCVVQPSIMKNTESNYINNNYVGKIFYDKVEYEEELQQLNSFKLLNIDPDNKFTVKTISYGELSLKDDIQNVSSLYNCIIKHNRGGFASGTVYQIILENGGKTLYSLTEKDISISFKKMLHLVGPFLLGIQRMHNAGFVHLDIKPLNILLNENKLSLIDFGLSMSNSSVFKEDLAGILSGVYNYYPDELNIAYNMLKHRNKRGREFLDELSSYINDTDGNFHKNLFQKHKEYMYVVIQELNNYVDEIYKENITNINNITFESIFNKSLTHKIDTYSLSSLFSKLHDITKYENKEQEQAIEQLFNYCKQANPNKRKNINEIVEKYEEIVKKYSQSN